MDIFKKNSLELILRFGDSDTNITYPYPCNIVHFYRWQLYFWSIVIACQFLPRILIFAKLIVVYFCFLAEDGSRLWLALAEVKQNNNRNRMLVNLATFLLQKQTWNEQITTSLKCAWFKKKVLSVWEHLNGSHFKLVVKWHFFAGVLCLYFARMDNRNRRDTVHN